MKKITLLFFVLLIFASCTYTYDELFDALKHGDLDGYTYVPDDNFEQALIDLGYDDKLDDAVLTSNINAVTKLSLQSLGIEDLTGIEDFKMLEELDLIFNNLTSLDVSQNTFLTTLVCSRNKITNLDVSNNSNLLVLYCFWNNLTSLDLSNNVNLIDLQCYDNQITSLDLSTNSNLKEINCRNNDLLSLNVKNGNNKSIEVFNPTGNILLQCIQIDSDVFDDILLGDYPTSWYKDAVASYSDSCQ